MSYFIPFLYFPSEVMCINNFSHMDLNMTIIACIQLKNVTLSSIFATTIFNKIYVDYSVTFFDHNMYKHIYDIHFQFTQLQLTSSCIECFHKSFLRFIISIYHIPVYSGVFIHIQLVFDVSTSLYSVRRLSKPQCTDLYNLNEKGEVCTAR